MSEIIALVSWMRQGTTMQNYTKELAVVTFVVAYTNSFSYGLRLFVNNACNNSKETIVQNFRQILLEKVISVYLRLS